MRYLAGGLILCSLLFITACGSSGGGAAPVPSIAVVSPNGGETWPDGDSQGATVTWTSSDYSGNIDIEYSIDGGATWLPLASDSPDDGSEDVVVPSMASTSAVVQVSAADADPGVALAPADQSDAGFEIKPGISLVSPNGGESWVIGSTATVTWSAGAHASDLDIDVSTDGGMTWIALVVETANDGSEIVTVPASPTHQARIRVSATNGDPSTPLAPVDSSDDDIQIGGPPTDTNLDLPGVAYGSLAWGDYDSDGDPDLLQSGLEVRGLGGPNSHVYRNDAGTLTDVLAGLPTLYKSTAVWGDYDNDGDLDLALAGGPLAYRGQIYRNDAGTFTDILAGLPGVSEASLAWGDYDNDGDLDLALAGISQSAGLISRIYRNDDGSFTDTQAGLPAVHSGCLAWADYDNDGDLDLTLAGGGICAIYRNDGGTFTDSAMGLMGVTDASMAWGDYDNDGDLDLVVAGGASDNSAGTRLYRNSAGVLQNIVSGLVGVTKGSLAWGDYDNDGDLDLAVAGWPGAFDGSAALPFLSRVYRNDGGVLTDAELGLRGAAYCALAWCDSDGDGDLDLTLAGQVDGTPVRITRIYRNDGGFAPNTAPAAPGGLTATPGAGAVTLSWTAASDSKTPQAGLSYNLRVGTTATTSENSPAMAAGDGKRRVPLRGPITHTAGASISHTLKLAPGTYFASVQAIDTSFAGGAWSAPVEFTVP